MKHQVLPCNIIMDHGKLNQFFINFLYQHLSKDYIPEDYHLFNYFDWKILGKYRECFTFDSFRSKPDNLLFEEWVENTPAIREWVKWCTVKIFDPNVMLLSTSITDNVHKRIAVSKLNKFTLPKEFQEEMFQNMIDQYYTRKKVFMDFYYQHILKLPF